MTIQQQIEALENHLARLEGCRNEPFMFGRCSLNFQIEDEQRASLHKLARLKTEMYLNLSEAAYDCGDYLGGLSYKRTAERYAAEADSFKD